MKAVWYCTGDFDSHDMPQPDKISSFSTRLTNVFTDAQFWVPLTVLVAGLALLYFLH